MTRMFALKIAGIALSTAVALLTTAPVAAGTTSSCGGAGLPCCPITGCDADLVCLDPCGPNGTTAGTGSGAQACELTCVPCGGNGEPCCNFEGCESGLTCISNRITIDPAIDTGSGGIDGFLPSQCVPCGDPGERCCNLIDCNEGAFCAAIIIIPCETSDGGGGGFNPCPESGGGGQLIPGSCVACGDPGQPCCPGEMCDTNALCSAGLCEACGQIGEQCCTGETCPNSQGVCVEDVCEPLQSVVPLMSWSAMLALVGVLSAVGSIGMRSRRGRDT